jgi:hypothetical protein
VIKKDHLNVLAVKKMKKTKNKHRWDETMVIAVMIVSVLCILLMLASYVNVTGKAASSVPTIDGVLNMINGATVVTGDEKINCNFACAKVKQTCILAKHETKLISCSEIFEGEYTCFCTST